MRAMFQAFLEGYGMGLFTGVLGTALIMYGLLRA